MTSVILSGPLRDWRETFVRWGAELRKIPFLFLDDLYWKTWDPTYPTTVGGMTFTGVTTYFARYRQLGGSLIIQIYASGTTGGVATGEILFTLPVNVKINQSLHATTGNGTVTFTAGAALTGQGNQVQVYAGAGAVWALAADRKFIVSGELELEVPQDRKAA